MTSHNARIYLLTKNSIIPRWASGGPTAARLSRGDEGRPGYL
jgi:hypothetical protein